jgi:hypothetical protein
MDPTDLDPDSDPLHWLKVLIKMIRMASGGEGRGGGVAVAGRPGGWGVPCACCSL